MAQSYTETLRLRNAPLFWISFHQMLRHLEEMIKYDVFDDDTHW